MMRVLRWTIVITLAAGVVFVAGSWIAAQRLTRARPSIIGPPPDDFPFPIESVTFSTADHQTLNGWFVPAKKNAPAIVLLHGFGGSRKQMLPRARYFREQGYSVLLYDARACGESTGDAITFGFRERHDLIAAVSWLKVHGHDRIACLGVSQGGATIAFAAEHLPEIRCAICESVYDEMVHAVDHRTRHYLCVPGAVGACLMVPFAEHRLGFNIHDVRPVDHIAMLKCPVFVISGDCDDKTSPDDTHRLFAAAKEPKELWIVPDAKHQDLYRFPDYPEKVHSFLRRHLD